VIHVDKDFQQPPPPLQLTFKSKKKKALAQHIRNLLDSQNGKTALARVYLDLERNAGPKYEYSLMMRQSLMRFDEFYLKSLLGEPWKILNQAYQRYLMRVAVEKAEGLR